MFSGGIERDQWQEMGHSKSVTKKQYAHLENLSHPSNSTTLTCMHWKRRAMILLLATKCSI